MEAKAIALLREAHNMLDNVHCYDTDLYHEITEFLEAVDAK